MQSAVPTAPVALAPLSLTKSATAKEGKEASA
jgi:hypothetical protein